MLNSDDEEEAELKGCPEINFEDFPEPSTSYH